MDASISTLELFSGVLLSFFLVGLAVFVAFNRIANRVNRKCRCASGRCAHE